MKKPWLKNISFYFSILSQSKINIRGILFVSVLAGLLIPMANVMFSRFIISSFMGELPFFGEKLTPSIQVLIVIVLFFLITTFAQSAKVFIEKKFQFFGPYLQFKLREGIQYRAMTMDFPMTEDKEVLNRYTNAENAASRAERIFSCVSGIASTCVLIIIYSVLVIRLHPALLLLLGLNTWVGYFFIVKSKLYDASFREPRAEIDRRKNYLFQTMFDYTFGKETRLYALYDMLSCKFMEQRNNKKAIKIKSENKALLLSAADILVTFIREAAVYGLLIWFFIEGNVTIENFVMYIGLAASFSIIAKGLSSDLSSLVEIDTYLTDYRVFTQELPSDTEGLPLAKLDEYTLTFRHVTFSYPGHDVPVLNDVSFSLDSGKHTSLVGLNGAGKTTVVKLICRLYNPNAGEILLNGININAYNKTDYYKLIAPVFQDSKLYAYSVMDNITLDENGNRERLWEILQDLGMAEKIKGLKDAEDTQVLKNLYDDGVEFSGGERQRLCIARAMYKGGGILLLDEPTAALDALAEKKIYEGFGKIAKGRTTLFISHRLNSNRFCDNIIFLENGKIIAQGSHDTLMINCPAYRDIYNMQARYYVDLGQEGDAAYESI